ncbi:MAG TPA: hypothetical protein VGS96_21400 [Thermoanaerobaculia bacterium]|nr:hypothetical protein [Thermoanaerobaculia bacterium]
MRIDADSRFVEQQNARAMQRAHGHVEPPLHPARKSLHRIVGAIVQHRPGESALDRFIESRPAQALISAEDNEVLADREQGIDRDLLWNDPDILAHAAVAGHRDTAEDRHPA